VGRRAGLFRVITIAALACGLAACGSAAPHETSPELGAAFTNRATAVCEKALQSKHDWSAFPVADFDPSHPDPSAFPKVAAWLQAQVAPTFGLWLKDLKALGEPTTGRKDWDETLTAVGTIVQENKDQIAAAKARDSDAFAAATRGLHDSQTALERATAAAGVPKCADVHA